MQEHVPDHAKSVFVIPGPRPCSRLLNLARCDALIGIVASIGCTTSRTRRNNAQHGDFTGTLSLAREQGAVQPQKFSRPCPSL